MAKPIQELGTIIVTKLGQVPRGVLPYHNIPRIGEWVEIKEEDGRAIMCEVIMVAHSSSGGTSDIYLKELPKPNTTDAVMGLKNRV